jgi:hypothetical protein
MQGFSSSLFCCLEFTVCRVKWIVVTSAITFGYPVSPLSTTSTAINFEKFFSWDAKIINEVHWQKGTKLTAPAFKVSTLVLLP